MVDCAIDQDPAFLSDLADLNAHLARSLTTAGLDPVINGNVCYATPEEFQTGTLSPRMAAKRHALAVLARKATHFLEVGVAGGHGLLVALHANPALVCVGIDLVAHENPNWPRTDIFVPAAMAWFLERFAGRVSFRTGPALTELAALATARGAPFDLIHLDAGKADRLAELAAIWPRIADKAMLVQGDALNGLVRDASAALIADGRGTRVDPNSHGFTPQRLFQVVMLNPHVDTSMKSAADMHGKRVLICVCHQDDETLFAGHLLNQLKGRADVQIASFFRPKTNRKDTQTRGRSLDLVARDVGAVVIQLPFAVEQEQVRLRRMVPLASDPDTLRVRQTRPISAHPLFGPFMAAYTGLVRQWQPDIVITHNHLGEYGHREHVFLNAVAVAAQGRLKVPHLLAFAHGLEAADFEVDGDRDAKNALYDHYRPAWDGPEKYDFALDPEGFVNLGD